MKRVAIRNTGSKNRVKPRVFDALIDGDTIFLEVKGTKSSEVIPLATVLEQIESAKPQ